MFYRTDKRRLMVMMAIAVAKTDPKVLMVADVVEAMSSHRPYRPSVGADAAIEEITAGSGVLYDPAVVDACAAVLNGGFDFWSVE